MKNVKSIIRLNNNLVLSKYKEIETLIKTNISLLVTIIITTI